MDGTQAVAVGATVQAINVDTNLRRETRTNQAGEYILRFLPVGNYRVEVSALLIACANSTPPSGRDANSPGSLTPAGNATGMA